MQGMQGMQGMQEMDNEELAGDMWVYFVRRQMRHTRGQNIFAMLSYNFAVAKDSKCNLSEPTHGLHRVVKRSAWYFVLEGRMLHQALGTLGL